VAHKGIRIFEKIPEQYIVWDGKELGWSKADIKKLRTMWKQDTPLEEIVNTLRPHEDGVWEVILAITYELYKGYIKPRAKSIIIGGLQ
jgi:hypothetical protein